MSPASPWWPPRDSGQWASWAQAAGVAVALVLTTVQAWRASRSERQFRVTELETAQRAQANLVHGWAALPRNYPLRGMQLGAAATRDFWEPGSWVVEAVVSNGSAAPVWNVVVELLDQQQRALPLPHLSRRLLVPGESWAPVWVAGVPAEAYSPSGATTSPVPLPVPVAMAKTDAPLTLRIWFADADGQQWSRVGTVLQPAAKLPQLVSSERSLGAALEMMEHTGDAPVGAMDAVRGQLRQALDEGCSEFLHRQVSSTDAYLEIGTSTDLTIAGGYTQAGHPLWPATVAGSIKGLVVDEDREIQGQQQNIGPRWQRQVPERTYPQLMSILVALRGLRTTPAGGQPNGTDRQDLPVSLTTSSGGTR